MNADARWPVSQPRPPEPASKSPERPAQPQGMTHGASISKPFHDFASLVGGLSLALVIALVAAGYLQHIYTCFTTDRWGFLLVGAFFPPLAIIHGWGLLLGVW